MYENGKNITYSVEQVGLPNEGTDEEYTYVGTTKNVLFGDFIITNRFRPDVDKNIIIRWEDDNNSDGTRPDEVIVQPTVDGEDYLDPIVITPDDAMDGDDNIWTIKIEDLPKYTEDGKEIIYVIVQSDVDKYTTSYSEDSFTITNKYKKQYLDPPKEDDDIEDDKKDDEDKDKDKDKNDNKESNKDKVVKEDKKNSNKGTMVNKLEDKTPKTGDKNSLMMYIYLMLTSAAGLILMLLNNKKRA